LLSLAVGGSTHAASLQGKVLRETGRWGDGRFVAGGMILSKAFSAGRLAVGTSGEVIVWDLLTLAEVWRTVLPVDRRHPELRKVCTSRAVGRWTSGADRELGLCRHLGPSVWQAAHRDELERLRAPRRRAGTVGRAGGGVGEARLWHLNQASRVIRGTTDVSQAPVRIHQPRVSLTAAAFTPDARLAVTALWDGTVHLWDAETAVELDAIDFAASLDRPAALAISPKGDELFVGTERGIVYRFSIATRGN
jgi:WD40 repeat protein